MKRNRVERIVLEVLHHHVGIASVIFGSRIQTAPRSFDVVAELPRQPAFVDFVEQHATFTDVIHSRCDESFAGMIGEPPNAFVFFEVDEIAFTNDVWFVFLLARKEFLWKILPSLCWPHSQLLA